MESKAKIGVCTPVDQFNKATQGGQNALWDWDLTTNRIRYSPEWISMLGFEGTEFGDTLEEWFGRIHLEDLEAVQDGIDKHLAQGSAHFEIRHRMLHQDGCYRWMSCQGVITRDDTGRAIRINGIHVDITADRGVDSPTGLPNRVLLMDHLTQSIQNTVKHKDFLFAVLIIDLDLFESGIDQLQTLNTDSLIVSAARRIEAFLKAGDISAANKRTHLIARSIGEEFIILLDGLSSLVEVEKTADALLKELIAPFKFYEREVSLSPSIGISVSTTGYQKAEEALRDADTALYRAKAFGKSCYVVFDSAAMDSARRLNRLGNDLEEALRRNEFLVHYQPILSLSANRILGFEALLRWNHPSRGIILPMEFIPTAERNGFIIPLGRWVLHEACRQLKIWKQDPRIPKELWVSVNLSGKQFSEPSLTKDIRGILLELGLDASGLVFELTEGTMMENREAARSLMMQLRALGARIGLDDFGTGYSSLALMRWFPLDFVKIDRTLIRSIETSRDTVEIVRSMIAFSRQSGLHAIAEGIENSNQLELLQSLQCEYGQGFLFSEAVDSGKAQTLLLEGFSGREKIEKPSASSGSLEMLPLGQNSRLRRDEKQVPVTNWKYVLIAITIIILCILGILVTRMHLLS
jgi:diguanylate cyclase (GGDEF)-like protein